MKIHNLPKLVKNWSDLEAAGTPLESFENRVGIDPRKPGTGLTIRTGRPRWRSQICELKDGRFAYVLPVFMRRNYLGKTIIRECWISLPWPDSDFEWLVDPREEGQHPAWYNFPSDTEHFWRENVLNHRILCTLSKGDIREGLLLAVGPRPPETYKDRDVVTVTFTFMDQWDCEHPAELSMQVSRRAARAKTSTQCKRGPLLSRKDVIPDPRTPPPAVSDEKVGENSRRVYADLKQQLKEVHAKTPMGLKSR